MSGIREELDGPFEIMGFTDSLLEAALAATDPAEVEAKGEKAVFGKGAPEGLDVVVVFVPAVEGLGVSDNRGSPGGDRPEGACLPTGSSRRCF